MIDPLLQTPTEQQNAETPKIIVKSGVSVTFSQPITTQVTLEPNSQVTMPDANNSGQTIEIQNSGVVDMTFNTDQI